MEVSDLSIRLVVLLLPGLISTVILQQFISKIAKFETREFVVYVILLGFISYVFVYFLATLPFINIECTFFKALFDSSIDINFKEILFASILSIFIGFLLAYIANNNCVYTVLQKIKFTTKTGNKDVWAELFENSNQGSTCSVYVVFPNEDLVYGGYVNNYSVAGDIRELILFNVVVCKNSNRKRILRQMDKVYLQLDNKNIIIEVMNYEVVENENKKRI